MDTFISAEDQMSPGALSHVKSLSAAPPARVKIRLMLIAVALYFVSLETAWEWFVRSSQEANREDETEHGSLAHW